MGCNFGILLILVNSMSPADFGIYSSGFSVLAMLTAAGSAGPKHLALRHLVRTPHKSDLLLGSYLAVTTISVSFVAILVWIFSALNGAGSSELIYLTLIWVSGMGASLTITHAFDAHHKHAIPATVAVVCDLFLLLLFLLMSYQSAITLIGTGILFAMKHLGQAVVLSMLYYRFVERAPIRIEMRHARVMLWSGMMLTVASLLAAIPISGQGYVARQLLGPDQASPLGTSLPFLFAFVTISSLASRVLAPHMYSAYSRETLFLRKLFLFQAAFFLLLFMLMSITSWIAYVYFMPSQYVRAWPITLSLMIAAAVYQSARTNCLILVSAGKYREMICTHAIGTSLFLASLWLTVFWGGLWAFPASLGVAAVATWTYLMSGHDRCHSAVVRATR
uniref:Polysaccharide biosynthesis protein n=2 Tax=Rubinisphaera brasiliensis TaxID=119 RepID=F0SNM9_RUBBR|nr:hypothetical protein [Rubinisphaera brasiliensis]ADY58915.1 hypothetical protein Plabr_1303 [Rubinisphaera brasiliensis DSM 5305]